MADLITEASAPEGAAVLTEAKGPGRYLMTLITPGWGSSGYYSATMLEAAAKDGVWPKDTQQHIDHQTAEEREAKPEGSIGTLASVLLEAGRWDPNVIDKATGKKTGGVVAEAKVFTKWQGPIKEMAEHIGISIVAPADRIVGEAEGRAGLIVEKLYPSPLNRVDYVTHPGRGGAISVIESAPVQEARNVGQWLEARMHSMFTSIADDFYGDGRLTREERITLSGGLGEALAAFTARVDADAPQLFSRDIWEEPAAADTALETLRAAAANPALDQDAARALVREALVIEASPTPVTTDPGQASNNSQEGTNMAEVLIESERLNLLEESHGRVATLITERDTAIANETAANRRTAVAESTVRARDFSRQLVRDANAELSESVVSRIVGAATVEIPLTDDLRLDTDALTESVTAARIAEETYIATVAQENGLGAVRGVGATEASKVPEITTESAREAVLALRGRK